MKTVIVSALALGLLGAGVAATTSAAEARPAVGIHIGGVGIGVGHVRGRYHHRNHWYHHRSWRHHGWHYY